MKKLVLLGLLCSFIVQAFSQTNSDSLAYQLQRKKINGMLLERVHKFGHYDQSLKMHTGIFGLQTKKDIKRSQDILMDIIRTDNAIYKELKILLEYRTYQQSRVQSQSNEALGSNTGYMGTINKLRQENDRLKAEDLSQQHSFEKAKTVFILLSVLMFASILYLVSRKRKLKV